MPVKGTYLAIAGGGAVLLWSGVRGKQWSSVLRNIIGGKNPATTASTLAIIGTPASDVNNTNNVDGAPAGSLAGNFQRYVGKVPYKWDGASPVTGWDCSGSFNYVANHDTGIGIPGFKPHTFTGSTHGPPTFTYQIWFRFHAQKIARPQVTTNDVCLWMTHMGVALDNTRYVSAFDTQSGTFETDIDTGGPGGETPSFWRL